MTITTTHVESTVMTAVGIGGTILGALDLINGRILKGAKTLFLGMTATNLGGRFQGLDPNSHSTLMKCALGAGTVAVGVQGALRLASAVKQKSVAEIIKGAIQTTTGIAGTAFVYSLDSRILVIAHQASVIALSSSFIAKLGFNDLVKGRYLPGLCKILLGMGGIASAGYYAYRAYSECIPKDTLSEDQIAFLEAHKAEIEELYQFKTPSGTWALLGKGASKKAFAHPDLPGMLIKIPNGGYRTKNDEDDLRLDYTNLEQIRSIAAPFDRIALPESHLYTTPKRIMIVEQRFDLVDYKTVPDCSDKQEAMKQFHAFIAAAELCDIDPTGNHNAGIISQTTPLKIGIFDFDCKNQPVHPVHPVHPVQTWDWNFRNVRSEFFVPQNRNQVTALVLAAGTAVLGGVATVAKKISEINPRTVLQLGFGTGTVTAVFFTYQDHLHQPASTMALTGVAMAATAVVTIVAAKAYSLVKGYLGRALCPPFPLT
jgi:hypothetical protein